SGSTVRAGLRAHDRGRANQRGGSSEAMVRRRAGTLCLLVWGALPRRLPFTRVGSRDHERIAGGVVVPRLRPHGARVPRLRIVVPASARASIESMEVVAGQGALRWSPSLVRLSRLLLELSRMRGLDLRHGLVPPGGSGRPTLDGTRRIRRST